MLEICVCIHVYCEIVREHVREKEKKHKKKGIIASFRAGSLGTRTRLGVQSDRSKFQIFCLPDESTLSAIGELAYWRGNGYQQ